MSPARALAVLLVGCTAQPSSPAPAEPLLQDIHAGPSVPPPAAPTDLAHPPGPAEPVPADIPAGAAPTLRLAAIADFTISLTPLPRGAIVAYTRTQLAGAPAGVGTLERDPDIAGYLDRRDALIDDVAGTWPDRLFVSTDDYGCRTSCDGTIVREDGEWNHYAPSAPVGLVALYDYYIHTPDGRVFGHRVYRAKAVNELMVDYYEKDSKRTWRRIKRYRPPRPPAPRVDVLVGDGPPPPARLAGPWDFTPDGDIVRLVAGNQVLRLPRGQSRWQPHLKPAARSRDLPDAATITVGADGRVYIESGCAGGTSGLYVWDSTDWSPLGSGPCRHMLAIADDGTPWALVEGRRLWHLRDGEWRHVPVRVPTRDGEAELEIDAVYALPGGDDFFRSAVVTTLPVAGVADLGESPGDTRL
jgi:hypothetical protein